MTGVPKGYGRENNVSVCHVAAIINITLADILAAVRRQVCINVVIPAKAGIQKDRLSRYAVTGTEKERRTARYNDIFTAVYAAFYDAIDQLQHFDELYDFHD